MPLAVPLHDVAGGVLGQPGGDDLEWLAERGGDVLDALLHLQDRVHRSLETAGNLTVNISHRLQVLVVATPLAVAVDHRRELRQRYDAAVTTVHAELEQVVEMGALAPLEAQDDRHRIAGGRDVNDSGLGAAQGDGQGAHDLLGADACLHGLFAIDPHLEAGSGRLDLPVDVDHTIGGAEYLPNLVGHLETAVEGRPVDLGDQRREHRRPGRNLGDLDGDAESIGHRLQRPPHLAGQRVRLVLALLLVHEVDLDVGDVAAGAQEVVTNESVEVEGRRGADVDLEVRDLGHAAEGEGELAGGGVGLLEGEALRGVDHDLELGLVVVWQHLDGREADRDGRHGGDQEGGDAGQEEVAGKRAADERRHNLRVQPREEALVLAPVVERRVGGTR